MVSTQGSKIGMYINVSENLKYKPTGPNFQYFYYTFSDEMNFMVFRPYFV